MGRLLTLKLDENVISKAQKICFGKKISLSRLIENYLNSLTRTEEVNDEISAFVKSLSTRKFLPSDFDWKDERKSYVDYQEQKHSR